MYTGRLVEKRGKVIGSKKLDVKKVVEDLKKNGKSEIIKPFFRLHPPIGGIKTKLHFPKGVLGNNKKEINKLIEKML